MEQRRVTVLVGVLTLAIGVLIPVAVWAGVQTFDDVPIDRIIHVVEGEASYSTLELSTITLGSQTTE